MDIWNSDKLIVFLAFFIPGFISIKIYDLFIAGEKRDFAKDVLEVVGYSALNYALLWWLVLIIGKQGFSEESPVIFHIGWFFVLLVMPLLWPTVILKVVRINFFSKRLVDPVKRPWDYVFAKREAFWIIVHLKDGRNIGGLYSGDSFASSFPADECLYLEELWSLDENGTFKEKVEDSRGALISCSEIAVVELKQIKV